MGAGSGTGSTVDPRPEMGGGSKAGSAAGSGGGLLANLPGIYLRGRRASLRRCRREYIFYCVLEGSNISVLAVAYTSVGS